MPRLVVAGLSGGSGKTLVSLALALEAQRRGIAVRAFKKGPDYIDAAWLAWATGEPARNLDTWLMGFERAAGSFVRNGVASGLNLVEGSRGLYDGSDVAGTHSTAELAKSLLAPVVLVVDATKMTRTAAALVLGCQKLDPDVPIAGVVLNQVAGSRHERISRDAIESICRVPVLGAVPRAAGQAPLPMRHLGLVTPQEFTKLDELRRDLQRLTDDALNFDRLLQIAQGAPPVPVPREEPAARPDGTGLAIGYLCDPAFSFYYPENFEALRATGAKVVPVPALTASALPAGLDLLYIGGGFPETHAEALSRNSGFLASIRQAASGGLPVYAECGGLMYLARGLCWKGCRHPMAGVLPFDVEVCDMPQGHGYTELLVDGPNAFFANGTRLKGHEFHYSHIVAEGAPPATACAVLRGSGSCVGRDAVTTANVWAAYTHLHAVATPEWGAAMIGAARSARVMA